MGYDEPSKMVADHKQLASEGAMPPRATPASWRAADSVAEVADTGRFSEAMLAMLRLDEKDSLNKIDIPQTTQ
jgi:hypothetical protein